MVHCEPIQWLMIETNQSDEIIFQWLSLKISHATSPIIEVIINSNNRY